MGRIGYDTKTPLIDESVFQHNADWKDFYGDVVEELPAKVAGTAWEPGNYICVC